MNIETNYKGFQKFFSDNKDNAEKEFEDSHKEFIATFDEVISIGTGINLGAGQKQKGTSLALYLRATKYLYTSHELSITGHTEESRILWRNAIELLILGFLILKEDEVYSLWNECHDLRIKHTDKHGNVDMEPAKDKKYWIGDIRKKYIETLEKNKAASHLYSAWKEFSTRYSHENMYNVSVRIESDDDKTEIYIGDGYGSKTKRMPKNMNLTLEIMQDVLSFVKDLNKK